jgi:hypothetical protein
VPAALAGHAQLLARHERVQALAQPGMVEWPLAWLRRLWGEGHGLQRLQRRLLLLPWL